MAKMIIVLILSIYLCAQENTLLDSAINNAAKLFFQSKDLGKDALDITKEYSIKGKNIFIEETLKNGINALVDTSMIEVRVFDIDDKSDAIKVEVFLKGEKEILEIDIKHFNWSVTKSKKHIVMEDLDISVNIPWMRYIIEDMIKRDNGYLKFPHDVTLFSLLYSIKPNKETTYRYFNKEPFDIVKYSYNKNYIDIKKFEVFNNKIETDIFLKGSGVCKFILKGYDLLTANGKTVLVLKGGEFISDDKPWIKSIIDKQNKEIHLDYNPKLYKLLSQ